MSGHNFWRRHNYIVNFTKYQRGLIPAEEVGNPYCDRCHVPVEVPLVPPLTPMEGVPIQTTGHLFAECGFYNSVRERVFGIPNALHIENIKKKDIFKFIALAGLKLYPTADPELLDEEIQDEDELI